jgi:hypothetical protein
MGYTIKANFPGGEVYPAEQGGATLDIKEAKILPNKLDMYKFAVQWCGKYAFTMIAIH